MFRHGDMRKFSHAPRSSLKSDVLKNPLCLQEGTNTIEVSFTSPVWYALDQAAHYPYRSVTLVTLLKLQRLP